ncbi:hypothetical protein [Ktedonosporobacter rubrisoli]|uniref:hypothetical protein n=1 Tax=Ktedonosporobacter rubrisoli TaxID=2509675 RepID=UPI001F5D00AF|nr:hypothetical protein [Ktedonosporobacter rubrisoli]
MTVEAVELEGVKHEVKTKIEDEEGMGQQEATQLAGRTEAFADTNEEGLEIGAFRMGRPTPRRTLGVPLLDEGPIEVREEGTILLDQEIMRKQKGKSGLVKVSRRGYHSRKLLCMSGMCVLISQLCKRVFLLSRGMIGQKQFSSNEFLAREILEREGKKK